MLPPDKAVADKATHTFVDAATKEHGSSARTFKSALIWAVADSPAGLLEDARKLLAWEDINSEVEAKVLRLDEGQKKQLDENLKKAQRDLKESVWRTYKNIVLLGKDNNLREVDLGLVHSSAADSIVTLILNHRSGNA